MPGTKKEKVMVRVSPGEKEEWINFSKDQTMSLSDIVRILVRKAIHNPSILYKSQSSDPSLILKEFEEGRQQLSEQIETYQKQNALLLQTLNSVIAQPEKANMYQKFQDQLIANPNIETLDTYDKVEAWLADLNPEWKNEIQIEKSYYAVIHDLIQKGKVTHDPRSKKLQWQL